MADLLPDVSFPLHHRGETAVVADRPPLRLLSLSGCVIDRGWGGGGAHDMTSPHWRAYLDLDDGAAVVAGGRTVPLRAGHLYVLPAWLRWTTRCTRPVRHGNALLDLPSLPRERVAELCPAMVHVAAAGQPLATAWLELLVDLAASRRATPAQLARGHALAWLALAEVFARLGPAAERLLPDDGLEALRLWVERRLDQPLPRAALARAAGCSEAELARRCAAAWGTSPARWLRERRVSFASELLRRTDQPLETVAAACGLGGREHFTKVFARVMGCPPATWRRRARAG